MRIGAAAIAAASHLTILAALLAADRPALPPAAELGPAVAMVFSPPEPPLSPALPDAAPEPADAPAVPDRSIEPPATVESVPPAAAPPQPEPAPQSLARPPVAEPPLLPPAAPRRLPPSRPKQATAHAMPRAASPASRAPPPPDSLPPVPHASPAASSAASEAALGWRAALAGWLQAHKTYPDSARRRGEQGRAVVRFTVARDGQVLEVQLANSSGSPRLDQAATGMLHAAHLPPFPAAMPEPEITATVPISYELEQ